jgi:hypothetical protein
MKLSFRGWGREVTVHNHSVTPVISKPNKYTPGSGTTLTWADARTAYGKVQKLALSGSFLVKFEFEEAELKNWLKEYVNQQPEEAIRLFGELEAEAVIQLAKRQAAVSMGN